MTAVETLKSILVASIHRVLHHHSLLSQLLWNDLFQLHRNLPYERAWTEITSKRWITKLRRFLHLTKEQKAKRITKAEIHRISKGLIPVNSSLQSRNEWSEIVKVIYITYLYNKEGLWVCNWCECMYAYDSTYECSPTYMWVSIKAIKEANKREWMNNKILKG